VLQGGLSANEDVVDRYGVLRDHLDSQAGGHVDGARGQAQRTVERREAQAIRHLEGLGEGSVGKEHDELVPTHSADVVGRPEGHLETARELLQDGVPGRMAQRLVDPLEVVAVEDDRREGAARSAPAPQFDRKLGLQPPSVQDLGQRIDARQLLQQLVLTLDPRAALLEVGLLALVSRDVED
jgi:hypothetical protein